MVTTALNHTGHDVFAICDYYLYKSYEKCVSNRYFTKHNGHVPTITTLLNLTRYLSSINYTLLNYTRHVFAIAPSLTHDLDVLSMATSLNIVQRTCFYNHYTSQNQAKHVSAILIITLHNPCMSLR